MKRSTSRWLSFVALAAACVGWTACGGNGADAEGSGEQDAAPAGEPGSASVTIGETTYEFDVRCMFGTMGVQGPGASSDGTPAFLVATFDPDEPEGTDIDIRVGTDRMGGTATQKWIAGDTFGNSAGVTWEGDRRSVRGSAPFRDRESDVVVEGRFEEFPGEFQVSCPAG